MRQLGFAALAVALLAAGCGASHVDEGIRVAVRVNVINSLGEHQSYSLRCAPASATLPFASRLCGDIARHPVSMLKPGRATLFVQRPGRHAESRGHGPSEPKHDRLRRPAVRLARRNGAVDLLGRGPARRRHDLAARRSAPALQLDVPEPTPSRVVGARRKPMAPPALRRRSSSGQRISGSRAKLSVRSHEATAVAHATAV
jgi:hypothetical protein